MPMRCLLSERGCGALAPLPLSEGHGGIVLFEEQFWPEQPSTWGRTRGIYLILLPKVLKDFRRTDLALSIRRFLKETVRKRSRFSICCRCLWLHVISV